ncbi:MAG: FtsX-like permease family protein [Bacteroidales bacterium]|nr:FtsX-like permease family protein [Bacteroidales bacterium]
MGFIHYFISKRYFFSRKSLALINVISIITILSYVIGTFALIIIISVFNGLEWLIEERYKSIDPDLKVFSTSGKVFSINDSLILKLKSFDEIENYSFVLEETAIIKYQDKYHPFKIKGVDLSYVAIVGIDTMIISGRFLLSQNNQPVAVAGMSVASVLNLSLNYVAPLQIFAPNRFISSNILNEQAFYSKYIYPVGIYSIDPEYDVYLITPIDFVRDLFQYKNEASSIEIKLKQNTDTEKFELLLQQTLGNKFDVKNRYEQHSLIYNIMKTEKIIVFLILCFILIIASFNITASLTMLILEKKEDIFTLKSLGLTQSDIRKIFQLEGWYISISGTIIGLILGLIICFIQQKYGLLPMEGSNPDAFIVKYYPVKVKIPDVLLIIITVLTIGYLTAKFPVRFITKKYLPDEHEVI